MYNSPIKNNKLLHEAYLKGYVAGKSKLGASMIRHTYNQLTETTKRALNEQGSMGGPVNPNTWGVAAPTTGNPPVGPPVGGGTPDPAASGPAPKDGWSFGNYWEIMAGLLGPDWFNTTWQSLWNMPSPGSDAMFIGLGFVQNQYGDWTLQMGDAFFYLSWDNVMGWVPGMVLP